MSKYVVKGVMFNLSKSALELEMARNPNYKNISVVLLELKEFFCKENNFK